MWYKVDSFISGAAIVKESNIAGNPSKFDHYDLP